MLMIEVLLATVIGILGVLLSPLLDGIERKLRATIQSRIGPPVMQTWYDIRKLFAKERRAPPGFSYTVYMLYLSFVLSLSALVVMPLAGVLRGVSGLALVAVLYTLAQSASVITPMTTYNPFAFIGASREIMIMLVNEACTLLALGLLGMYHHSSDLSSLAGVEATPSYMLVAALLLIAGYVSSSRIPYDLAEAEPELASGVLIEFGGPYLALYMLSIYIRRFATKYIASYVLLAPFIASPHLLTAISLVTACLLWICYAAFAQIVGRSRVDVAPLTLFKLYLPILLASLLLRALGM